MVVSRVSVPVDGSHADWQIGLWRAVLDRVPEPHPFLMPEWSRAWWEYFADGELAVVPIVVDEEPIAVAPLHRSPDGVVRFVGGLDLTDYPGPAVVPGRAPGAAAGIVDWLESGELDWTELDVRNARAADGFADAVADAARAAGFDAAVTEDEAVAVLSLPAAWDEYAAGLPRHARHELRRKRARLFRELRDVRVHTADDRTLGRDLEAFFSLHRLARGEKASFMTEQNERFFRRIASDFLATGMLRLDILAAGSHALAATFGFQTETTFFLYNMAFDPDAGRLAPGFVLVSRLLERALEDGLDRFDFLRGLERYKLELGAQPTALQRVRVRPLTAA
jgi:CelD/BcsL family acetyltransferase involved in cellulose biosynthesis